MKIRVMEGDQCHLCITLVNYLESSLKVLHHYYSSTCGLLLIYNSILYHFLFLGFFLNVSENTDLALIMEGHSKYIWKYLAYLYVSFIFYKSSELSLKYVSILANSSI